MWDIIEELVSTGTTVLLTTQYLDEADRLAHRIAVVDRGRVIAEGTSDELKAQVGGEWLEVTLSQGSDIEAALAVIRPLGAGEVQVDMERRHVTVPVSKGTRILAELVRELDAARVDLDDLALRRPTLDDVFLTLTGHVAEATDGSAGNEGSESKERDVA